MAITVSVLVIVALPATCIFGPALLLGPLFPPSAADFYETLDRDGVIDEMIAVHDGELDRIGLPTTANWVDAERPEYPQVPYYGRNMRYDDRPEYTDFFFGANDFCKIYVVGDPGSPAPGDGYVQVRDRVWHEDDGR